MKELDKKLKRKIGVLAILGILLMMFSVPISFAAPIWTDGEDANDSYYISIDDDDTQTDQAFAVSKHGDPSTGVELFRVQEDGNVGIGRTNPGADLHIGDMEAPYQSSGSVDRLAIAAYSHPQSWIIDVRDTPSQPFLDLRLGSSTKLTMNGMGYVGIGTDYPVARCHIVQSDTSNICFFVEDEVGDPTPFQIQNDGKVCIGVPWNYNNKLDVGGSVAIGYSYAGQYWKSAPANGMIVQGDVGIGTSSPGEKLSVNGNVLIGSTTWVEGTTTGDLAIEGNVGIGTANPSQLLDVNGRVRVRDLPAALTANYVVMADLNGVLYSRDISTIQDADWYEAGGTPPDDINDDIYTNGSVGIGTADPQEKLHVADGSITVESGHKYAWVADPCPISIGANTHIGAGYMTFYLNGEQMRLQWDGAYDASLGLGTTSPDEKFEVAWDDIPKDGNDDADVEIGRGTQPGNENITFIALRNVDGEQCWIYPNADQDAIIVSDTHP